MPPNSEGVLSFLTKYLELDAGQLEQLKKIVADSRDRYVALSQQYKPQTEAIRVEADQADKTNPPAGSGCQIRTIYP
ncbi:MAG: hypothetical protein MZV64_34440 [Ignavibacteriales bacterium]|nr:hypothetical protein [Ignavibacteriales bacterium]